MSSKTANPAAVLDTNTLVSGLISRTGTPNSVLRAWQRGAFTLITSQALVDEAADVLSRPAIRERFPITDAEIDALLTALSAAIAQPLPIDSLPVRCRDPKDDIVLACALGGGAGFIITGDADLRVLDGHPAIGSVRIVTPLAFLDALNRR